MISILVMVADTRRSRGDCVDFCVDFCACGFCDRGEWVIGLLD
jgi:hypothetical protein